MLNSVDFSGRPFHFIGIGGIGMSALAYVIAKRKLPVSGSDIRPNHITQRLQAIGAHIFGSQDATNLEFFRLTADSARASEATATVTVGSPTLRMTEQASFHEGRALVSLPTAVLPQVICSTAINPANAEYRAALELGCPIFHRSDLLAALIQDYRSIAVAGTHGKTTTSSMIGYLLLVAGLDPTIVVGGEVAAWEGNARVGEAEYLVAEADESDGSLVKLAAQMGVVTNIELDHPDHYENLEEVIATFQVFAQRCQTTVGCIDCATVRDRLKPTISYSLQPDSGADYTADCALYRADGTTARVWERGKVLGQLNLKLLGRHNLSNALAAVAVGRHLGLEFATIAQALATFEGARRRFENRGEVNGIRFIDDYAHHPSEISATLAAARIQAKELRHSSSGRVVAIFQPHRYSRTLTFLSEFGQCFQNADLAIVTDIYSAGEQNPGQISGELVAEEIAKHHPQVTYQPSLQSVYDFLTQNLRPGDLVLFLGAGNLNQAIPEVIAFYQKVGRDVHQECRRSA
ncbi:MULTISPECIES: UDP-N-acetylmuramate--L-alanine ligase [Aerosakkonema]|uniref:UDP-N-acetylmuramate--L-alanine ligase n=1 Tax=Aerosakkonema TaxID=1246629 RepID=UPI0035B88618